MTTFVGRQQELEELERLLATTRLLTLTGTGGCGKTRLALQLSSEVLDRYAHGAWLVDLAPISDPSLVPQAVMKALGLQEEASYPVVAILANYIRPKHLLLVLDNCDHLIRACATLVTDLLAECPGLQIVVTSRVVLEVQGETMWRVPSLSKPEPPPPPLPLERLTQFEAVRLFIDRALAVVPSFSVSNENAPALAELCYRLDGIPLAIELAAPWLHIMTVEDMTHQLNDRFRLLASDNPIASPRHQTLRAAIDWTHDLLSESERRVFRRLAVFVGGFTLDALTDVCSMDDVAISAVPHLLLLLVNKSLVLRAEGTGEVRFRTLESIREYGLEQLRASGESERTKAAHASYFTALVAKAQPELSAMQDRGWWDRLEIELDNLRAALRWLLDDGEVAQAVRLAAGVGRFWLARGYLREGRDWLERLLQLSQSEPPNTDRVDALFALACITHQQGDATSTRAYGAEGATLSEFLGYVHGLVKSLTLLGLSARAAGDYTAARSAFERSLEVSRGRQDRPDIRSSLVDLGIIAALQADYDQAQNYFDEGLAIARELGDRGGTARIHYQLGRLAYDRGQYVSARAILQESLMIYQELGDRLGAAYVLSALGLSALAQSMYEEAGDFFEDSLRIRRDSGDNPGSIARSMDDIARLAIAQRDLTKARSTLHNSLSLRRDMGINPATPLELLAVVESLRSHAEQALTLLGAASAIRDTAAPEGPDGFGAPAYRPDQSELHSVSMESEKLAGDDMAHAAYAEGWHMTIEQAITYALQLIEKS